MDRPHPLQDQIESCPFCKQQPQLTDWPGRQLKVLIHKCRVVHLDRSAFPSDVPAMVAEWNQEVAAARQTPTDSPCTALAGLVAQMESLRDDMERFAADRNPGVQA